MWSDTHSVNRLAAIIGAIASVALLWCLLSWASSKSYFALRQVRVVAPLSEVDPGLLESAIRTELRGTFFSVSPARTRATLKKLPWVRDVSVRRRWPLALDITINEHRAVGYWGDSDLLSDQGEVFRAGSRAPMPRFDAPVASAAEVLARYREAKVALASQGLDVKALVMSPRGAITLTTGSELQIEFGREQFTERLQRFTALYASWPASYRAGIAKIDMRYKAAVAVARGNGVSVSDTQKGQS
jgi:cell division protein FtsQ